VEIFCHFFKQKKTLRAIKKLQENEGAGNTQISGEKLFPMGLAFAISLQIRQA
jgi:hypothetical protein